VNGFNVVYQQFITICMQEIVRSAVTGPNSSLEVPCCR